jgi:hypothetical protein
MVTPDDLAALGWQGMRTETYFSGALLRFTDDREGVVMGRYFVK